MRYYISYLTLYYEIRKFDMSDKVVVVKSVIRITLWIIRNDV